MNLASERCQELMAEDPERQHRRQYLLREKAKVDQAQHWLSTVKKEEDGSEDSLFCRM
jgi:SLT domain-containing protein